MSKCICKGNWRKIVKESEGLLDKEFKDGRGKTWWFFGIVHGSDDYYYGMQSKKGKVQLLSCVASLGTYGFVQVP